MSIKLLLDIIRSRKLLIFLTLAVTVVAAGALTYIAPTEYTGTTSLVLNYDGRNPFDQASPTTTPQLASTYVATQLDIVRSQKVALKVVDELGLDRDAGWREAYAATDPNPTPIREWIAAQIRENVEVEQLPNSSRVVTVSYEAGSPSQAATFANAFAQAYIATSLELTIEPARRNAAWFDQQLKTMRARLDEAQSRMTTMQAQRGVVSIDEKLDAESGRLDEISRNLVQAQMATAAARARQLGRNHPEYRAALQQEQALMAQYEAQKRNILRLQAERDELGTLANEIDGERQNYETTLQSYFRSAMESQFNQTNIAILSPATAPSEPSSPNVPLNMISAIVLGLFLGIVGAVLAEMSNPRVRPVRTDRRFLGEPLVEVTRRAA
jgi:uncharacterized protein involved in exopolysaccharide biosynthesis